MSLLANLIIMVTTTASVAGAISVYLLGRLAGIDGLDEFFLIFSPYNDWSLYLE